MACSGWLRGSPRWTLQTKTATMRDMVSSPPSSNHTPAPEPLPSLTYVLPLVNPLRSRTAVHKALAALVCGAVGSTLPPPRSVHFIGSAHCMGRCPTPSGSATTFSTWARRLGYPMVLCSDSASKSPRTAWRGDGERDWETIGGGEAPSTSWAIRY